MANEYGQSILVLTDRRLSRMLAFINANRRQSGRNVAPVPQQRKPAPSTNWEIVQISAVIQCLPRRHLTSAPHLRDFQPIDSAPIRQPLPLLIFLFCAS
jgi:hypothetical protein